MDGNTPIICTYLQLVYALLQLHRFERSHLADLHDIWLKGAPTPNSIIRNPVGYDPRKIQTGNHEARIVPSSALLKWVQQRARVLGYSMSEAQASLVLSNIGDIFANRGNFPDLTEIVSPRIMK